MSVYFYDVCHTDVMCRSDKVCHYDDYVILKSRVYSIIRDVDRGVIMTFNVIHDGVSL